MLGCLKSGIYIIGICEPILHRLSNEKEYILMGDFNVDHLRSSMGNATGKLYESLHPILFLHTFKNLEGYKVKV